MTDLSTFTTPVTLSWAEGADLTETWRLTKMLHVRSDSQGTFTVTVYTKDAARLYVRAHPTDPIAGCLVCLRLEPLLPVDADMTLHDQRWVNAWASWPGPPKVSP
jgi:hypothetical protein